MDFKRPAKILKWKNSRKIVKLSIRLSMPCSREAAGLNQVHLDDGWKKGKVRWVDGKVRWMKMFGLMAG